MAQATGPAIGLRQPGREASGRDHDPALGADTASDWRRLRPSVGPGSDHDGVVPWPDEVEQFFRLTAVLAAIWGLTAPR